jgi:hypothetical protein
MWTALLIVIAVLLVLAHDLSGGLAVFEFLVLLLPLRGLGNLPLSLVSGKLLGVLGFQEGLKVVLTEFSLDFLWGDLGQVKLLFLGALLELVVGRGVSGGGAVED